MDRGVWWATVHRVAKSGTRLKRLSRQSRTNQGMRGKRWTGPNSEGLDPAVSGTIRAFFARQHNAQVCSQQKQGGYDGSNGDTGQCLCQDAEGKKSQHKRKPEFPIITQESRRNSRKTTWLPRHRKMRPLPATASKEKSQVSS